MKLKIEAMSCGHCVKNITNAVKNVDEAAKVDVDLKTKMVDIETKASLKAVLAALDEIGYDKVQVVEA